MIETDLYHNEFKFQIRQAAFPIKTTVPHMTFATESTMTTVACKVRFQAMTADTNDRVEVELGRSA
jgi:hypothetical protein